MPPANLAASPVFDILAFILGLCVGSFLNVLALRVLAEESIVTPASNCPHCKHKLSILDNIPLLSYLCLKGKCRYCQVAISLQYPLVELITAILFVAIGRRFLFGYIPFLPTAGDENLFNNIAGGIHTLAIAPFAHVPDMPFDLKILFSLGMIVFTCTLIAISITDFKTKLIPHEITYPSMLVGILFSIFVRHDLLGTMAGIGASYILFDFIAFYGLKIYMFVHKETDNSEEESNEISKEDEEEIEVMGGGDAVLSAVMAAYLGWQMLIVALAIGFIAGTIMGLVLLIAQMQKSNILSAAIGKLIKWSVIGLIICAGLGYLLGMSFAATSPTIALQLAWQFGLLGAFSAGLLAVVTAGSPVSKPFPFGPALALGGLIAMFLIPNWIAFH